MARLTDWMSTFLHSASERRLELTGELTLSTGQQSPVEIVVLREATILLSLRLPLAAHGDEEPPSLHAATVTSSDGQKCRLLGHFHVRNRSMRFGEATEPHCEWSGDLVGELQREIEDGGIGEPEYGIANLICGADLTTDTGTGFRRDRLQLEINGVRVELRRTPDYDAAEALLRATKGVAVTHTRRFLSEVPRRPEAVVDRLCNLLTLATGTLVTWTEHRRRRRQLTIERLRSAITRAFSPNRLISKNDPEGLKRFVSSASSVYDKIDGLLPVAKLAHAWSDVSAGAFLETRALNVCSTMDLMTNVIGQTAQWPAAFRTAPFEARLMAALQHLGLHVPGPAVHQLTTIRNQVVHGVTLGSAPRESFELLAGMYGRMLLAFLGYEGHIQTWPGRQHTLSFWEDRDWDRLLDRLP